MKVLILSVGAGSGHNRAAQAVEKAFRQFSAAEPVEYLDCLTLTNTAFKDLYSKGFIKAVQKAPNLWNWAFEKTDVPWQGGDLRGWIERINTRSLRKKILDAAPTLIVCTHFMPAAIVSRMLRKSELDTHLSIVVTDYYVHASWLTEPYCRYFVAHEEGRVQLEAYGIAPDRITVSGIPIDPVFAVPADPAAARKQLGLPTDRPVILLSAGAAGTLSAREILELLATIRTPADCVIVCGRNAKLKSGLEKAVAAAPAANLRYHIVGFTDQMDQYMAAADLFIGKPGGLSSSECLARGLPMILWDPIPGQEVFNSVFLLEHAAAVAPIAGATLGYKVDAILQDPDRLKNMKRSARAAAKPAAAQTIVETLLATHRQPSLTRSPSKM